MIPQTCTFPVQLDKLLLTAPNIQNRFTREKKSATAIITSLCCFYSSLHFIVVVIFIIAYVSNFDIKWNWDYYTFWWWRQRRRKNYLNNEESDDGDDDEERRKSVAWKINIKIGCKIHTFHVSSIFGAC